MPEDKAGKFIPNDNFRCKRDGIEQEPPELVEEAPKPKKTSKKK